MKKRVKVMLAVLLAVAALRTAIIFYRRRQPAQTSRSGQLESADKLSADDYVIRRKIYAYDVKSAAAELRGRTVWVSAGNQITCYRVTPAGSVDFKHEAGLFAPLERLRIENVVLATTPGSSLERQVMAIVSREGMAGKFAAPIGAESEGNYRFIASDIFFVDDPHQLYQHWPADVWAAIDRHEVKPGMNELQTSFALGTSVRIVGGTSENLTAEYTNAGKPVRVTFAEKRVSQVVKETAAN